MNAMAIATGQPVSADNFIIGIVAYLLMFAALWVMSIGSGRSNWMG